MTATSIARFIERVRLSALSFMGLLIASTAILVAEEVPVPLYDECRLLSIFPAGGQVGQTVVVRFHGYERGLKDASEILIDGPPGITVREIKNVSDIIVDATLEIASDAPVGRRCLRVVNARSGVTNMMYFMVGRLPEIQEAEPNHDSATSPLLELPIVVNGQLNPAADRDCFRFTAKAGQRIVAAVLAQAIDSHGQYKDYGYVDAELTILDASGKILAEAQDTLGLDPLIEFEVPADGEYIVQVQHVLYRGFPQAVYRLNLGEIPFPTAVFPPGGQRGREIDVEFIGPHISPGTTTRVAVPADDSFPFQYLSIDGNQEIPFVRGDLPEAIEHEPNDNRTQAENIELNTTVNARFNSSGDSDWYKIHLTAGQPVLFETLAHRYLLSPVDTHLAIYDMDGKKLAENDDGFTVDYMLVYDFQPPDSRLTFTPQADGDYFVHVTEQTSSGGPRSVYRLSVSLAEPDFLLDFYPDAVPIWGPGGTASFVIHIERLNGLNSDIEFEIEGLPDGWVGSTAISNFQNGDRPPSNYYAFYGGRVFLTITAPKDVPIGTRVPFRVVGRARYGERTIERHARPTTLYYTSDIGFFRLTPTAWAVVADYQGPRLMDAPAEITAMAGSTIEVPLRVENLGEGQTSLGVVVNLATIGVACSLSSPVMLPVTDGKVTVPVKLPNELPVGRFPITIARTWRSDIRTGMPGPCTPIIQLEVIPAK